MKKIDPTLFKTEAGGVESPVCPECGGQLVLRRSKSGLFWGCSQHPLCHYVRPVQSNLVEIEKVLDDSRCPECGQPLAIKKGRYGLFIGCTGYPACQHIESSLQQPEENTLGISCPECQTGQLVARTSRYGKQFYACSAYPACKFTANDRPVAEICPDCGFPILLEKKLAQGIKRYCPRKGCTYHTELL